MSSRPHTDLWNAACAAIQEVQKHSKEDLDHYMQSGLPPTIPTGEGRQVLTTQEGINAIWALSEAWRSEQSDRKARITQQGIGQLAVREFGQMLAENGFAFWTDTDEAIRQFKGRLQERLGAAFRDVDHYFPCHMIESKEAISFNVGPVRFLRRLDWLKHVSAVAGSELAWTDAVRRHWEEDATLPEEKTRDTMVAGHVIKTIGLCQWIASVTVGGNEFGRSEERALYAVRLAIDAIGLVLSRSQAINMRGPGDELRVTRTGQLSQYFGMSINTGVKIDRPHLFSHPPDAEEFISSTQEFRDEAGWAINAMLHLAGDVELPALKRRWCDALYWFGEARRDATEFTALVRYGMCLDVLAKGSAANGITTMLSDLLACQPNDKLLSDGTSIKKVIKKIYEEGRSQLGHGGRPALLEDLPIARETADQVVQLALPHYLMNLKRYNGADNPDEFLKAIPSLVAATKPAPSQ